MRFAVLGPLEVTDDGGQAVDVGGRQPRLVLAALVAAGGRPVSAGALIEAVWGDDSPPSAAGTLQTYVSRLRRVLLDNGGPAMVLDDAGYRLELRAGDEVDVARFDELAAAGKELLAAGDARGARASLAAALEQWRGRALIELVDNGAAVAHAVELEERRIAVLEERLEADLALGGHAHIIGELLGLVGEHPLREGLHAQLALALYRSGRQADALRALAEAGSMLREELGLEPSPALRALEAAILAHDPSLELPAGAPSAGTSRFSDEATVRAGATPFVGRDLELGELVAALKEAAEHARFVVIEGDPGIGKTRLVDELARAAAATGSLTLRGRSNECGATPALWPWLPVLAAVAPVVDDVPAPLREVLAGESPLLARQGAAVQFERFDAIAATLERATAITGAPVVVLLDDLQWADEASLELLQFLTMRLDRGVLVAVTVRPLAVGQSDAVTDALGAIARREGHRRLRLRGLSVAATVDLLDALAPEPVPPDVSARIHARAEGNPFYAIELARLLDEDADAARDVPASVRDAVRRRLGHLDDDTLEVLTIAAVTGREIDLPVLARATACDIGRCLDLLDPAAALQLLVQPSEAPGTLRFDHALVREVLLDGLTPTRRVRLHLQVADAITAAAGGNPDEVGDRSVGRDDVEVLAEHLWQSVVLAGATRTAAALERSAETAISRVAYTAAEDRLSRAAQLRRTATANTPDATAAELTTLLRLLEVMQATRYFSGTDRDVLHRAQELAVVLGLEGALRKLRWSEWAALSTSGRIAEAQPMARAYFERWGGDPRPRLASAAHACLGIDESTRGCFASAVEHLDRAAALLADLPPPDDAFEQEHQLVAHAFGLFSHAAHGSMSPEEALGGFDFLLAVVPPVAVPAVCAFGGAVATVHARWDALDELVRRALAADPAAQFAFFGGQLMMFEGLVAAARGDLDTGLATFTEARTRYRAVGGRVATGSYQALLGELAARDGRVTEAAEVVAGARLQNDETGEGWNDVTICIAEAVVAHAAGDATRAAQRMAAGIARGRDQEAHGLIRRAVSVADEFGIPVDRR